MAKKILSVASLGISGLIGGKKKAAAPAATTAASTAPAGRPKPIITQLGGGLGSPLPRRPANPVATLLSNKLGA